MLTGINIIQELLIAQQQEDELSCFHPIEVWKAIDLFIRIKEKEEAARESTSTTQFCLESSTEKGWLHFKCLPLAMDELKCQVESYRYFIDRHGNAFMVQWKCLEFGETQVCLPGPELSTQLIMKVVCCQKWVR